MAMAGRASEWAEVDLVGRGYSRLKRLLSFAAHPMGLLSAAEHLGLTWMIRETVHAGWTQDYSLDKLTDALIDEGPVLDGDAVAHSNQAAFAAIPNESLQDDAAVAEVRAMTLMVALGKDLTRFRRLPVVAADAIRLEGIRVFADLSAAPVRLEWLRLLAARMNVTLTDGESSLKWLYQLTRLAPLLSHATVATLSTQMGSEVAWRAAVATVRQDGTIDAADRAALAAAAAGAGAAAAAAVRPVRGADQYEAAKRPTDYSTAFVARLLVNYTQADVDGSVAAIPPVVGTINVEGSAAAKVILIDDLATVLQEMHSYTADQLLAQAAIRRACVGIALKTIAQKLDLSPSAMQKDVTDDEVERLAAADLIGHAMELVRQYKAASEPPAAAAAAGAAAAVAPPAAMPHVMTLDAVSIAALSASRGGAANAPGANDVLNVGKCAVAAASDAYVQAGDTTLFLRVRDEVEKVAVAARAPDADVFVLARSLSSDATKLLAKVVHADDKTKEPRLGYLTELQERMASGALLAVQVFFQKHSGKVFTGAAFADEVGKAKKTAFAAMRRSSLVDGGPHILNPLEGGPKTVWEFIKARCVYGDDKLAHKLRDIWGVIFCKWGEIFEALAGTATGMKVGTQAIVVFLAGSGCSDGVTEWTPQQIAYYVGVLLHKWYDTEKLWRNGLSADRLSLTDVSEGTFMTNMRAKMHEFGVARAVPDETPFTELTFRPAAAPRTPGGEEGGSAAGKRKAHTDTADGDAASQTKALRQTVANLESQISQRKKKDAEAARHGGGDGDTGKGKGAGRGAGGKGAQGGGKGAGRGGGKPVTDRPKWTDELGVSARNDGEARSHAGQCMGMQRAASNSASPLKGICMHCLDGSYGCRSGGKLGGMGECGNAHGAHPDDKEAIVIALQEANGMPEKPIIVSEFFNSAMIPSQPGWSAGGGKGAGRGGGKGGKNGGRGGGKGGN